MVPYGYTAELYNQNGFKGSDKLVVEGPMWTDSEQAMSCINVPSRWNDPNGWNDKISSIAVYRTNKGATAQGRWVGVTGTESIDFTYHMGLSSTESHSTKESIEAKLSLDMHAGIEFEGLGESVDISESLASKIEYDTTTVYNESISVD